jgi:hypothetical protein
VFKNCKFSFFFFLLFFFAKSFRNFHPRNSRFTLCSCLFFCVQELPLCVLFFFFSSPTQLFCSLGLATLRGMEVIPHHISLQKHLTNFQNCSFFKPVMNRDLLKLGFRTGWGGIDGVHLPTYLPTRGDGFGVKGKKKRQARADCVRPSRAPTTRDGFGVKERKKSRHGRIVSDRHGHPLVLYSNCLVRPCVRPSRC